jgi:hypothetical protein
MAANEIIINNGVSRNEIGGEEMSAIMAEWPVIICSMSKVMAAG